MLYLRKNPWKFCQLNIFLQQVYCKRRKFRLEQYVVYNKFFVSLTEYPWNFSKIINHRRRKERKYNFKCCIRVNHLYRTLPSSQQYFNRVFLQNLVKFMEVMLNKYMYEVLRFFYLQTTLSLKLSSKDALSILEFSPMHLRRLPSSSGTGTKVKSDINAVSLPSSLI